MVLVAFLVGLACALAAIVFVSVQGVRLWRQAKRSGGSISAELASFEERAAHTERLFGEAERSSKDLDDAVARLRVSRAQLNVLLGSVESAKRRTRWLGMFAPLP
jgi:hypothetical protein